MSLLRSLRRSGTSSVVALCAILALLGGCIPRYGFAGGGLPSHVRTMAILPFDNETPTPELQKEILDAMRRELQSRLGVRDASEERADALVRGVVRSYDVDVPVGFSANQTQGATTSRRKLQITLDVTIVDQTNGKTLWEKKGLRAEGEYAERDEAGGRRDAIKRIVNDIVEGAQSQW
jgi:hypothetical protein